MCVLAIYIHQYTLSIVLLYFKTYINITYQYIYKLYYHNTDIVNYIHQYTYNNLYIIYIHTHI